MLFDSSTRLVTPSSESNTWSLCTSVSNTFGAASLLILTASAVFPLFDNMATLSVGSLATTTPWSWKLLVRVKFDRPPNKFATEVSGGPGWIVWGGAATGR